MTAIDERFAELRRQSGKAFMPFITAGDPDLATTAALLERLDLAGCHFCEVGIPYSDPIADGPVIQASYTRALDQGISVERILESVASVAPQLRMPLVCMVSYAIVFRLGVESFVTRARAAGFSGAIIPDLMVEDAEQLRPLFQSLQFDLVQLVTPTTPRDRARRIAASSSGFVYYVSVTGITGERSDLPARLVDDVTWLRGQTELPVCIGFGIGTPEQARRLAPICDGIIVGSAIVRRIADQRDAPRQSLLDNVSGFAEKLLAAVQESP